MVLSGTGTALQIARRDVFFKTKKVIDWYKNVSAEAVMRGGKVTNGFHPTVPIVFDTVCGCMRDVILPLCLT